MSIAFRVSAYDEISIGTAADETLTTGAGARTPSTVERNDRLLGERGYEVIDGGLGDDVLRAALNGATDSSYVVLDGGSGHDRLSASGSHAGTVPSWACSPYCSPAAATRSRRRRP
ncbi:MAG: hypothetical protein VKO39_07135 [Cyanobacteriota bacterium]|nr:hypothetical protein [Cyanobacteriota bacterium]